MIQITVKPEKFINCPPPEVTEEMVDWILLTLWVYRPENWYKKIESVNIRANQSYEGSGKIHFYISFNGDTENEFHREFWTNIPLYHQHPSIGYKDDETYQVHKYGTTWNNEPIGRWYWMEYFIRNGIDMGEEGVELQKKLDNLKQLSKLNAEQKRIKDAEEQEYQLYLRLKAKFEPTK